MTRIRVPGDKSITQRALILAALADGESRLSGLLAGEDPRSTAAALRALGARVPAPPTSGEEIIVRGGGLRGLRAPRSTLDFGNSGTGVRLMMGVLAGQSLEAVLDGDASLRSRPMQRVTLPLEAMGARFTELGEYDRLPVRITGGDLTGTDYASPVASAQVKSAVLLAGLVGGVGVTVTEPHRSRDHTERMFGMTGVRVESGPADADALSAAEGGDAAVAEAAAGEWEVAMPAPPEAILPLDFQIPGDPSSAAFLLALGALGGAPEGMILDAVGLNPTRVGFLDAFRRMGVAFEATDVRRELPWEPVGSLTVPEATALQATEIGGAEIPALIDEIPILAVLAARAEGVTRITGARELRVKETDRIRALVENLRRLGIVCEELGDGLEIEGTDRPLEGSVRAYDDHRIAMAFGVLGAQPGNRIEVDEPGTADVSFPGFWRLLRKLERRRTGADSTEGVPELSPAPHGPVVTLDGPAGSGKSSTAREVASRLEFRHLDSGALYRAIAYALQRAGVEPDRWKRFGPDDFARLGVRARVAGAEVELFLGGERLGTQLRTPEVTAVVSELAGLPAVRDWLLGVQRGLGEQGRLVADGRDMGSVVFPDAELKVFLVAQIEERARRRLVQDGTDDPTDAEVAGEAERLGARDRADSEREHSPLVRPEGALEIDTTELTFEAQVEAIVEAVSRLTPS